LLWTAGRTQFVQSQRLFGWTLPFGAGATRSEPTHATGAVPGVLGEGASSHVSGSRINRLAKRFKKFAVEVDERAGRRSPGL